MTLVGGAAQRVVVVGGGPGGYESALVAAQLGAQVTVVDRDGLGGAAVLTDCVPSKTLISTSDFMSRFFAAAGLGVRLTESPEPGEVARADLPTVNHRVKKLARAQSDDIEATLGRRGVRVLRGTGRLLGPERVSAELADGGREELEADVVLLATGARPRELRFLRTRGGLVAFLTLSMDGGTPLGVAHARASEVEELIRADYPEIADVIVHTEP
jgi:dihydrolipoamide dehydrogenase